MGGRGSVVKCHSDSGGKFRLERYCGSDLIVLAVRLFVYSASALITAEALALIVL